MSKIDWLNSLCLTRVEDISRISYNINGRTLNIDLKMSIILHKALGQKLDMIKYYLMTNYNEVEKSAIANLMNKNELVISTLIVISNKIKNSINSFDLNELIYYKNNLIISRIKSMNLIDKIKNQNIKEYSKIKLWDEEDKIIFDNFIITKYNLDYIRDRDVLHEYVIPESADEYLSTTEIQKISNELLDFIIKENLFTRIDLPVAIPYNVPNNIKLTMEEARGLMDYFHYNRGLMNEWFLCSFVNVQRAIDIVYLHLNEKNKYSEVELKSFIYDRIILLSKPFILKELESSNLLIETKILYWLTEILL